jgi:hypothetical protein
MLKDHVLMNCTPCPLRTQMVSIRNFLTTTLALTLFNGSNAFSYNPQRNVHRIQTSLNAESSSALHYRQGNDNSFTTSTLLYASSGTVDAPSEEDIDRRIEAALNNARDMDRRYGLCTQPSIRAWQIVDELYMMSAASQEVENCVKSVLGTEKSVWSLYE